MGRRSTPKAGFEALTPLGGPRARVRFPGSLQGRPVIWEAHLLTLASLWAGLPEAERGPGLRRFLQVSEPEEGTARIEIGLDVPAIDEPTVLKTVLMVRQWRRLHPGRHEYGPALRPGEPA